MWFWGPWITAPFLLLQAPVCSVLREFEAIQKEQKETNNCTEKRDWWQRRSELDRRMKVVVVGETTLRPDAGHISERVGGVWIPPSDTMTSCRASSRPWRWRCWAAGGVP